MNKDPIAIISRNTTNQIRISWSEFKGHKFLDIRCWCEPEGKPGEKLPTKKGVTLAPDQIDLLIDALQLAKKIR